MVHDRLLDQEHVDQFRTLIFPNIAALSTEQCKQISDFVDRGGSIIATYETSLYDEWGVQRKDFGLASLFGASYAGKKEGPMQNSYLELKKDPATGQHHPLVAGFEDAGRIINTIRRVHVVPINESQYSPLTMIPTYPDLPMEECFPPKETTHDPGVFVRQVGKGRVVYFPGDLDRTFWDVMSFDHAMLLRNAVAWATDEAGPVVGRRQRHPRCFYLGTEELHDRASGQPDQSHDDERAAARGHPAFQSGGPCSRSRRPPRRKARLLVAGTDVHYREENGAIVIEVPAIDVHEVVALDYAV